ncbi:MAG: hypothetical protein IJ581_02580 [Paludibacteraceae bacterium]|nr:hypothetical protein [Paludibacteraceae bacterium]
MASANLLGKLLASYLSTSNDTLAVSFRAHYQPACSTTLTRPTPSHCVRKKNASPRLVSATFSYRYKSTQKLTQLYQCLLNAKWIAADTKPDDFLAIFSGEESTARVKWLGKPSYLYYLIRKAVESQLISIPMAERFGRLPKVILPTPTADRYMIYANRKIPKQPSRP